MTHKYNDKATHRQQAKSKKRVDSERERERQREERGSVSGREIEYRIAGNCNNTGETLLVLSQH